MHGKIDTKAIQAIIFDLAVNNMRPQAELLMEIMARVGQMEADLLAYRTPRVVRTRKPRKPKMSSLDVELTEIIEDAQEEIAI